VTAVTGSFISRSMPKPLKQITIENRLLAALPREEYERLLPKLQPVSLPIDVVLNRPEEPIQYVYFPGNCVISMIYTMKDGASSEVGLVGNEGMSGMRILFGADTTPQHSIVRIAGRALRMRANALRDELRFDSKIQILLLRYAQALLTQTRQAVACNSLHTIDKRLCRELLMLHDRVKSDRLPLTHEIIARMLGTQRAGITLAAGTLQRDGLIRYSRGKITILNRAGLESCVCECYEVIKQEFNSLLGGKLSQRL
jgi:CRP-like cAMP-binding protein